MRSRYSVVVVALALLGLAIVPATAEEGGRTCQGLPVDPAFEGDAGPNKFFGTPGDDVMHLGGGNDVAFGRGGDDVICGGGGDDIINGHGGNDSIQGGAGNDVINAGSGDDDVSGGVGDDTIKGDAGNDHLDGGVGRDTIGGGRGNDVIDGGGGKDALRGNAGSDIIDGSGGRDEIKGGTGGDTLRGGPGKDRLNGQRGDDILVGHPGFDHDNGGLGFDTCDLRDNEFSNCEGLDPELPAGFGEFVLSTGFLPDPRTFEASAGGVVNAAYLSPGCAGLVTEAPTLQVTYTAGPSFPLGFTFVPDDDTADTMLVVNDPSGNWHCDDDGTGGLDPELVFATPESGAYDIWIGVQPDADFAGGILEVSEL